VTRLWVGIATAISSVGAGLGYAADHDPTVFLTVPVGVVLMGAAVGIGTGLAVGLAEGISHRLRDWMN
jgi:hypothetical protein